MIRGESGVGKKLLARLLHYLGPRADEPFVLLECGQLPSELLEGELFGYEQGKGAGAQTKRGCLEVAGEGTVVLDEVAALPLPVQARLAQVLQQKKLDGSRSLSPQARVIALTRVDLEEAVRRHSFLEELYSRLNAVCVQVPPLRERPSDVRPLAEYFLQQLGAIHSKAAMKFSAPAMALLDAYSYPGNVRELRRMVETGFLNSAGPEILVEDLPLQLRGTALVPARMSLEDMERKHIAEVLSFTGGKKTQAAQILGISRKTLLEKRKRYGLG